MKNTSINKGLAKKIINPKDFEAKRSPTPNFYDCATPTILFGVIMGTIPILPVKVGLTRQLVINKYTKSLTLLYLILYTLVIILGQRDSKRVSRSYKKSDSVANVTSNITFFMTTAATYTIYINSFKNVSTMKEILRGIYEADTTLKRMGQQFQYKTNIIYQIIGLLSFQFLQFFLFSIQTWNAPREHLPIITFAMGVMNLFPFILQNLVESQYVLLTMSMYQRFNMVNQYLYRLDSHIRNNDTKLTLRKLHVLVELHDSLCDISSLIDDFYGGQMFASTLVQFEVIVTKLFSLYINCSRAPIDSWISFGWCLLKMLELLRKVTACHVTGSQAGNAKIITHKLLLNEPNEQITTRIIVRVHFVPIYLLQLMEFSQQLTHRKVVFTASGMFIVDATLLFMVISTVANYVVILYQFNESSQTPVCVIPSRNSTK